MTTVQQLLGEFIDAWNAGRRPDVVAYLERADGDTARDELAAQLSTWLDVAPAPAYDSATLAAIGAEPALRAALDAAALAGAPLSARLATLRERAGLAVRDVAVRLVALFGLEDERRAANYLERVERDELDAARLSPRLVDALAGILGADRDLLAPASFGALSFGPPMPPAAAPAGQAFFRSGADPEQWIADDIDALSRAALAPAPTSPPPAAPPARGPAQAARSMDELDRLFLGGPDA